MGKEVFRAIGPGGAGVLDESGHAGAGVLGATGNARYLGQSDYWGKEVFREGNRTTEAQGYLGQSDYAGAGVLRAIGSRVDRGT